MLNRPDLTPSGGAPQQPVTEEELSTLKDRLTLRQVMVLARAHGAFVSGSVAKHPRNKITVPEHLLDRYLGRRAASIVQFRGMEITSVRGYALFKKAYRYLKETADAGCAHTASVIGQLVDDQRLDDAGSYEAGWNAALDVVASAASKMREFPEPGDV